MTYPLPGSSPSPYQIIGSLPEDDDFSLFLERTQQVATTIMQLAIRLFFPVAATLFVASIAPLSFQASIVTIAALSFSVVSGLFFQPALFASSKASSIESAMDDAVSKFLAPPPSGYARRTQLLNGAPPIQGEIPKGIYNRGNNCWLNSILQILPSSRSVFNWIAAGEDVPAELLRFRAFYHQQQQSNRRVDSQRLREAVVDLSRLDRSRPFNKNTNPAVTQISRSSGVQEDAQEGLVKILDELPVAMKVRIQEVTHYNTSGLPKIMQGDGDKRAAIQVVEGDKKVKEEVTAPIIGLSINKADPHLQTMLNDYFHEEVHDSDSVLCLGEDGLERRYHRARVERRFINAPESLFIQIKRFAFERAPKSLATKICACLWPELEGSMGKDITAVAVPEELQIELSDGSNRRYRLNASIVHEGNSLRSGHYVAYAERGGHGFCFNDIIVTPLEKNYWPLDEAYLLHYELVQE